MILEWERVNLEMTSYRTQDTLVLKATDKIIDLLEDHIIKTQAMKGSAFIKPFEGRLKNWEDKLTVMQQLITEWLQLQSTYLYLKPVFSSEDIMLQMPSEARRFAAVDLMWKNLMKQTSEQPNLKSLSLNRSIIDNLIEANKRLEAIKRD